MSNTAALQLEVSSSDLQYLDSTSIAFVFDNASALDLLEYAMESLCIPDEYTFVIKYKTVDFFGNPKIAVVTSVSPIADGQLYYLFISPKEDTPGALVPRTPHGTKRRLPDSYDSAPATTFRMLNFDDNGTPRRRMHQPFTTEPQDSVPSSQESATITSDATIAAVEDISTTDVTITSEPSNSNEITVAPAQQPATLMHRLHPLEHGNRSRFLGELYERNKPLMDEKFAEMQPSEPFLFHNVNVTQKMAVPRNITAFVILKNIGLADYDIRVGALVREIARKFLVDIVMEVKKTIKVNKEAVEPLVMFLNETTGTTFFSPLLRPGGPLFEAIRKRESREEVKKGFIPRKKTKLQFTDEHFQDIEESAKAAAAAHTQEEVEAIIKNSRKVFFH